MDAAKHPDYAVETEYLGRVVQAIDQNVANLQHLGWSGAGNPRATVVIGERLNRREDVLWDLRHSPYFGRMDRMDGISGVHRYYIGQTGLREPTTHDRLVVDWRTEVASHFYRPDAQTRLKRRFTIRDGKLLEMFDDHVAVTLPESSVAALTGDVQVIADAALRRLLEGSRGQQLENIVATIQADQDELIRASDKALIVQGGAGTGKTIVALHRLAYLLYHHRNEAWPRRDLRVAVFGPNRLFLHFISAVLPSLGEHGVLQTTFEDWFSAWCGKDAVEFVAWDEELERILDPLLSRETRADDYRRARWKGSLRMGEILRRFVDQLRDQALCSLRSGPLEISVSTTWRRPIELTLPGELLASVAQSRRSLPLNRAHQAARDQYWQRIRRDLEAMIDVPGPERTELLDDARRKLDAALEKRWPRHHFGVAYRTLLSDERLLHSVSDGRVSNRRPWLRTDGKFRLEDLAPLAYLRLLLDGIALERNDDGQETGAPSRFDHIVVDEAQDFAPLQIAVLRAHAESVTLIGDMAQGIHSYRGLSSWDEAREALGGAGARLQALNYGYRSTRQITEFGNHVLESIRGAGRVHAFPREGESPRLERATNATDMLLKVASYIREVLSRDCRTVAVIAKSASHARATYLGLRSHLQAGAVLVTTRDDTRSSAVTVLPAYLAKGMEFDAVAVVDADASHYRSSEYDAKLLYIAVTRALHRLLVVWTGRPSPLLPSPLAGAR